jgi:glycosyltransferase involved in cell wall biosynthesis
VAARVVAGPARAARADVSGVPVLELLVSTRAGGGPAHVLTLARALGPRGYAPAVAGPRDGPVFDDFVAAGIEAIALATDRLRPATLARVVRLVRARGIRLVHSHGKGAGLYGRLAARLTGRPAIHTFHGLHHERYAAPARAGYLALERALARWTRTVINVSEAQAREGLSLGIFTAAQSRVIVNGIDAAAVEAAALDRAAARRALGLPAAGPVIGCAARFDEVKRLDVLLDVAARLPGDAVHVVLIGAGDEAPALRARAAPLGARAHFAGEIPAAARLFRALDVYVATARKEGMPLAVLEAMALGLPVAASAIDAHREVLGPEAPLGADAAGLAAVVRRFLDDPAARQHAGTANRARVAAGFGAAAMVDAVAAVYGAALGV